MTKKKTDVTYPGRCQWPVMGKVNINAIYGSYYLGPHRGFRELRDARAFLKAYVHRATAKERKKARRLLEMAKNALREGYPVYAYNHIEEAVKLLDARRKK